MFRMSSLLMVSTLLCTTGGHRQSDDGTAGMDPFHGAGISPAPGQDLHLIFDAVLFRQVAHKVHQLVVGNGSAVHDLDGRAFAQGSDLKLGACRRECPPPG